MWRSTSATCRRVQRVHVLLLHVSMPDNGRCVDQFPRGFALMKHLTAEQCPLTDAMRDKVLATTSCDELYDLIKRDFWYVGSMDTVGAGECFQAGVCVCAPFV